MTARAIKTRFVSFALCFLLSVATASACPNCKNANEIDPKRPRAYMYSILFMIGMPATIFTGFGISFYRMTVKHQQMLEEAAENESSEAAEAE